MIQDNYSEICPVDIRNPFRNPTEEPDYSPDYREILPTADMPDCRLPLLPQQHEKSAIRRFLAITFLMLLFAFLTANTLYTLLQMVVKSVVQQVDLRALKELPENYDLIVRQFLDESAVNSALTLISFTVGNLLAFLLGIRITGIKAGALFRLRNLTAACTLSYILLGLWLQQLTSYAADWVTKFFSSAGIPVYAPDISLNASAMRTLMIVLYICVLGPITEELLVRGFVLKNLSRVSQRFGILLSALLFALMHENISQFLFTFPFGILLAYITVKHNSLTPAIITHILVNSAAVLMELGRLYLPHSTFRHAEMIYTLAILLLGTVSLFYMLLTERLPELTPHQSTRSKRLLMTAPLFWVFVLVHLGMAWFAAALH